MAGKSGRRLKGEQPSDDFASLLSDAKAGDNEAVAVLYREHVVMVSSYFRACHVIDPDDLTGDTFLGMLSSLQNFSGTREDFRTWLMTIAHRRLVDYFRQGARGAIFVSDAIPPDGRVAPDGPSVLVDPRLVKGLERLTPAQREIIALRFVADLSLKDTARITGRPITAVKSLQKRGVQTLRRSIPDLRLESRLRVAT